MTYLTRPTTLVAALAILFAGCQSATESSDAGDFASIESESMPMGAPTAQMSDVSRTAQATLDVTEPAGTADRQLIRTGDVRIRAQDHAEAVAQARQLADSAGGFIGEESSQRYADRVETTLSIRVPSQRFDTLLTAVSEIEGDLVSRNVSVDDVTRQVADVTARLGAKRAAEEQYLELMERSGSIEDVLAVQTRLQQVREEIESAEAQLRALRDQVSLSTLTVTLFEASAAGITSGPRFVARVGSALSEGWDGLLELTLGLLTIWPLVLVTVLVVWLIVRRRRQKRIANTPAASEWAP
ncbi:MAG: DUF4349 domain-containing protein [Bacteroidota bacterium]